MECGGSLERYFFESTKHEAGDIIQGAVAARLLRRSKAHVLCLAGLMRLR
jgi:hypothetical protein